MERKQKLHPKLPEAPLEELPTAFLFSDAWRAESLEEKLASVPIDVVPTLLASSGKHILNLDLLGIGPLEELDDKTLERVHAVMRPKAAQYKEAVQAFHDINVRLRRPSGYATQPGGEALAIDTGIRNEGQWLHFLFNQGALSPKILRAVMRYGTREERAFLKKHQASFERMQTGRYTVYERERLEAQRFTMTAYRYGEAFAELARRGPNYPEAYPFVTTSAVRFKTDEGIIEKAARHLLEKGREYLTPGRNNPMHLSLDEKRRVIDDARVSDYGGIQLFFSGESPTLMETIRRYVLDAVQHDDRITTRFKYIHDQVDNRAENPKKPYLNDLLMRFEIDGLEEGPLRPRVEMRVKDLRNEIVLELGPHAHSKYVEQRKNEGLSPSQVRSLAWISDEFRFPANRR